LLRFSARTTFTPTFSRILYTHKQLIFITFNILTKKTISSSVSQHALVLNAERSCLAY